jgi:hypothetical protein
MTISELSQGIGKASKAGYTLDEAKNYFKKIEQWDAVEHWLAYRRGETSKIVRNFIAVAVAVTVA